MSNAPKEQIAVVGGAVRGIGLEIARRLAAPATVTALYGRSQAGIGPGLASALGRRPAEAAVPIS
jgi:NAD(P)-dependent dehydrogenase (short-subunit alcohol dehydrogenase family)